MTSQKLTSLVTLTLQGDRSLREKHLLQARSFDDGGPEVEWKSPSFSNKEKAKLCGGEFYILLGLEDNAPTISSTSCLSLIHSPTITLADFWGKKQTSKIQVAVGVLWPKIINQTWPCLSLDLEKYVALF